MKTETMKPASVPHLQALQVHQVRIEEQELELQRLSALKTSREAEIATADEQKKQWLKEFAKMEDSLADLLADIEAGEDKQVELEQLRSKMKEASDLLGDAGHPEDDVVPTGMGRKIERAQAALNELQAQRPQLVRELLLQEAEAMGAEYLEAALKTISVYHRLCALDRLLMDHGHSFSFVGRAPLQVPCLALESVSPRAAFHAKEFIHIGNEVLGEVQHLKLAERQRIESMGVDLTPQVG